MHTHKKGVNAPSVACFCYRYGKEAMQDVINSVREIEKKESKGMNTDQPVDIVLPTLE